jgi:glycosyltransferase involved in cell wall biosynthesis
MPKVSIIITNYNYGKYLSKAIESVLSQDFPRKDYEVIVVDDGSTDKETPAALAKYRKDILLIQRENRGLSVSCNEGISASSGDYIVRLDADDEFLTDYLKETVAVLDKEKGTDFVYSDYLEKKEGSERIVRLPDFSPEEIRKRGDFLAIGTMYRREVFARIGMFDENLAILEHYDLVLRAIAKGLVGRRIHKPLFIYTKKSGSMSTNIKKMFAVGKTLGEKYGFAYQKNEYMP